MAGNVTDPSCTQELIIHGGVDIVKLQIGPGSACETRRMTGVGYGTLSCVINNAHAAHGLKSGNKRLGLVCSDGGCRYPGDVCKSFAAGADFTMLGGYWAGADCCDGQWNMDNTFTYYGMSTHQSQNHYGEGKKLYRASEGTSITVPNKGPIDGLVQELLGGLRSSCAYIGSHSIKEMNKCAHFTIVNKIHNNFNGAMKYGV
jgi:GMP reductase